MFLVARSRRAKILLLPRHLTYVNSSEKMTTSQSNDFYCAAATKLQIVVLICLLISSSGFNSWGTNKQHRLLGSCVVSKHPSCELCLFRSSCNEVLERHYSLPSQLRRRERERQGRLFYMKTPITTVSSKLPMASTDSSNDVSNDSKNLFIRLWGWFRKLLAKLWVSSRLEFPILICNFTAQRVDTYIHILHCILLSLIRPY